VAEGPDFRPHRLTNYLVDDGQELSSVVISPDGKHVVYVRGGDADANWPETPPNPASSPVAPKQQIWSVPFSGGEPKPLVEGGDEPAISPKSDVVAFERDDAIWVSPIDGSAPPKRIIAVRGENVSPEWSPDGSRLALFSRRGDHSFIGVFANDSSPILYLSPSTSRDSTPRWSPDGKHIAFTRRPGAGGAPEPAVERSPNPWEI
jgi:Tol biopolymer transport system component